jgi:hypothetical protein
MANDADEDYYLPPGPGFNYDPEDPNSVPENMMPPGPGYNLAPHENYNPDPDLGMMPPGPGYNNVQPLPNGPGFADGPPISGPQYEGNRGTIEDFLRDMLESARPTPPPMDDSQIMLDRPNPNVRGNVVTPIIDPSANTLDDYMEIPSDIITKRGMQRYDDAEGLVQQMIHKNLNNRKFR